MIDDHLENELHEAQRRANENQFARAKAAIEAAENKMDEIREILHRAFAREVADLKAYYDICLIHFPRQMAEQMTLKKQESMLEMLSASKKQ